MRFGFHLSIYHGYQSVMERALELGCQTIQIFTGSNKRWHRAPLDEAQATSFKKALQANDISPLVVHLFYLPNLASPDVKLLERSRKALALELERSALLGAQYLVLHPGAYKQSSLREGLRRTAVSLDYAMGKVPSNQVRVLIENTAGGGTRLGGSLYELAEIADAVKQSYRVGVCLDTAHAFQYGYPVHDKEGLEQILEEFENLIGLDKLELLHLNDSRTALDSCNDRHWHIGKGLMGMEAFRRIINHPKLKHLPAIMETPTSPGADERNMKTVKELREEG